MLFALHLITFPRNYAIQEKFYRHVQLAIMRGIPGKRLSTMLSFLPGTLAFLLTKPVLWNAWMCRWFEWILFLKYH
jgi:hypothetical protein